MTAQVLTIPISDYLADPAPVPSLTRSLIVTLLEGSPYSAWYEHPKLNPDRPKDDGNKATDIGTAAHSMLFEDGDALVVIDAPDYRTKAAQGLRDAARESGKAPILIEAYQSVRQIVQRSKDALEARGIDLDGGHTEQSIIWQQGGVWLRTRPDWNGMKEDWRRLVVEYKTTELSPGSWKRGMAQKGYDVQAWMHREAIQQATDQRPEVLFLVQQTTAPFEVFFVGLSELYYELAGRKVARAADIWSKCLLAGKWPSYPIETEILDPLSWQIAAEEEREVEHQSWSPEAFLFGRVKGE